LFGQILSTQSLTPFSSSWNGNDKKLIFGHESGLDQHFTIIALRSNSVEASSARAAIFNL
jgi:hypothetical protein